MPLSSYNAPSHDPTGVSGSDPDDLFNLNEVTEYSAKNAFRMAAYHRLDLGVQFHKTKKHGVRTIEIGIYNVYNRKNPYFYFIGENSEGKVLKQISLFPIIPSISYNFKFMKTSPKKISKIGYEQ